MNMAVFVSDSSPDSDFIVETFFPLFERFSGQRPIIITDVSISVASAFGLETIVIKPQPKNPLLKKIWVNRTLRQALKKANCDIFISTDNSISITGFARCLLIIEPGKMKGTSAKKAELFIVMAEKARNELANRKNINKDKIVVVYPSPGKPYTSIDEKRKEAVKNRYTGGKEYFLYSGKLLKTDELIDLLKSFSHFKKRQQSSFKLSLLCQPDLNVEKAIENYKYRDDIIIIRAVDVEEKTGVMAASFALVLPFNNYEDIHTALNAMQSGVPVITIKESSLNEIGGEAVLYAENEIKDIGEKMMQLYKDEGLRSRLIEKGKETANNFTQEKSASQLLQSIMKVPI